MSKSGDDRTASTWALGASSWGACGTTLATWGGASPLTVEFWTTVATLKVSEYWTAPMKAASEASDCLRTSLVLWSVLRGLLGTHLLKRRRGTRVSYNLEISPMSEFALMSPP